MPSIARLVTRTRTDGAWRPVRPWWTRNARRLTAVLPYVAMIMSDAARASVEYAPVSADAVLIVDSRGVVQSVSAGGAEKLHRAFNPDLSVHTDTRATQKSFVKRLLRQLQASMSRTAGSDGSPPAV